MLVNEKMILEHIKEIKESYKKGIIEIASGNSKYQNFTGENLQYIIDDLKAIESLEDYIIGRRGFDLPNAIKRFDAQDLCILIDLLREEAEKIDNDYEKKEKQGKITGSIIDAMRKDGMESYYNRVNDLAELFRQEFISKDNL